MQWGECTTQTQLEHSAAIRIIVSRAISGSIKVPIPGLDHRSWSFAVSTGTCAKKVVEDGKLTCPGDSVNQARPTWPTEVGLPVEVSIARLSQPTLGPIAVEAASL